MDTYETTMMDNTRWRIREDGRYYHLEWFGEYHWLYYCVYASEAEAKAALLAIKLGA